MKEGSKITPAGPYGLLTSRSVSLDFLRAGSKVVPAIGCELAGKVGSSGSGDELLRCQRGECRTGPLTSLIRSSAAQQELDGARVLHGPGHNATALAAPPKGQPCPRGV